MLTYADICHFLSRKAEEEEEEELGEELLVESLLHSRAIVETQPGTPAPNARVS
jgi:hypothetical protein